MAPITYLTYDGILDPLGFSQVARVLMALSRRGFEYRLLSFERAARLADRAKVEAVRAELSRAGVEWETLEYAQGGARAFPKNALMALAKLAPRGRRPSLLHARSYVAAFVGRTLLRRHGVPYLFDARGYWIDERRQTGRLFRAPFVHPLARHLERRLYEDAAAMVGLTQLHVDDVEGGRFGRWRGGPTAAIPTCADYDEFVLREDADDAPPDPRLVGRFVVGLIGSLNFSYHSRPALALARRILELRPDAVLLGATQQRDEFRALAREAGVPDERSILTTIPHAQMPRWMRHVDVVPQLLIEDVSKRGSMPTKLAEMFASGVRPLHVGCNSEVSSWVARAGTGHVLPDVGAGALEAAARLCAGWSRDVTLLRRGREITAAHFSLAAGIDRYAALLSRLGHSASPRPGASPCAAS
jgi:hypothetical protein